MTHSTKPHPANKAINSPGWPASWVHGLAATSNATYPDVSVEDDLARRRLPDIRRLLSDPTFKRQLERQAGSLSTAIGQEQSQIKLQDFMVRAVLACTMLAPRTVSKKPPSPTQGIQLRKLRQLIDQITTLTDSVQRMQPELGMATSVRYLEERLAKGNGSGLNALRQGMNPARFKNGPSIDSLLASFEADIQEETSRIYTASLSIRKQNSRHKPYYPMIDALCRYSLSISTAASNRPNFELVASALQVLSSPTVDISPDLIRKRYGTLLRRAAR